ncbi:MAG: exodeoxyribonuclease VII large subunit [Calditerrivibrio sp.]|nr:exodeoxyribonuclease VII large subunit [Calditerrivibrio sp.]
MMTAYTVKEITKRIKDLIEKNFNTQITVVGEVSNLSESPSKHIYFNLKDDSAQIKVVFFKMYRNPRENYEPKNGDKVYVTGDITVYEKEGNYQIIAKKIEYDAIGDFYKKFINTKTLLEKEGLFDHKKKKDLPNFIKKIAVLTSPQGAAITDFLKILHANKINIEIDLWGVRVQGNEALYEIVNALNQAGKNSEYDLLILMRGGGSLDELSVFNEESIARALFNCDIPTITAIGHERDTTIADLVADVRASTPTDAANKIVEIFKRIIETLEKKSEKLTNIINNSLFKNSQYLDNLYTIILKNSPQMKLNRLKDLISQSHKNIQYLIKAKIYSFSTKIEQLETLLLKNNPSIKIQQLKKEIIFLENKLHRLPTNRIEKLHLKINSLESILRNLDPDNIIKKGYCIITKDKKVIVDVRDVALEDTLEIKMKNGYIQSFVTGKKILEDKRG